MLILWNQGSVKFKQSTKFAPTNFDDPRVSFFSINFLIFYVAFIFLGNEIYDLINTHFTTCDM